MNEIIQIDGGGRIWASNGDGGMRLITLIEKEEIEKYWALETRIDKLEKKNETNKNNTK